MNSDSDAETRRHRFNVLSSVGWQSDYVVVLLIIAFNSGCASTGDALPNRDSVPAQLFQQKCSVCHATPHPKRHYAEQWPAIVTLMQQRMLERGGIVKLSDDERAIILAYLRRNSR